MDSQLTDNYSEIIWNPCFPEHKFRIEFSVAYGSLVRLKLFYSPQLDDQFVLQVDQVMHGVTNSGKPFTLYETYIRQGQYSSTSVTESRTYHADVRYVLWGTHLSSDQLACCSSICMTNGVINQWLDISDTNNTAQTDECNKQFRLDYPIISVDETMKIFIGNNKQSTVTHWYTHPWIYKPILSLLFEPRVSLREAIDRLWLFQKFIFLLTGKVDRIDGFSCSFQVDDESFPLDCSLDGDIAFVAEGARSEAMSHPCFKYSALRDHLGIGFNMFLNPENPLLSRVIGMYMGLVMFSLSPVGTFLHLAQILDYVSYKPKDKNTLENKTKPPKKPSLEQRLMTFFESHSYLKPFMSFEDRSFKDVIKTIVCTRNYYVHGHPSDKTEMAQYEINPDNLASLILINNKLTGVIRCYILHEIGLGVVVSDRFENRRSSLRFIHYKVNPNRVEFNLSKGTVDQESVM